MQYNEFLESKMQFGQDLGFDTIWQAPFLFDFQSSLVNWALRKGRAAIFADCGLGKTPMQLVWAENVVRHTNRNVLIVAPLAVSGQTVHEGDKFGISVNRSSDGSVKSKITVTNYERLGRFNSSEFAGMICDESSILKNFDGATKSLVTEFMRKIPYRLLCTATAAPNDYIELGTSSEALGNLGYVDMLKRFFRSDNNTFAHGGATAKFTLKGHAEKDFWCWICSWARACRKPSDLGFSDGKFILPPITTVEHIVSATTKRNGWLFDLPAQNLNEQREERKRTIDERCETAARLVNGHNGYSVAWCHLNTEGSLLAKLINGAVEVSGSDSDDFKIETFDAFAKGQIKSIVSKPTIAGWGLNWQHCNHQTFFPSHSFEQWYQSVRRSWRFGQKQPVKIDVIASEGEQGVLSNLNRKAIAADRMFASMIDLMNNELKVNQHNDHNLQIQKPVWL